MEKYKLKGTLTTLRNVGTGKKHANWKVVRKSDLPPLSMESYVFTGKKLQKKKKQVRSTLQEAESLMALELGRTLCKKKRRVFGGITR